MEDLGNEVLRWESVPTRYDFRLLNVELKKVDELTIVDGRFSSWSEMS